MTTTTLENRPRPRTTGIVHPDGWQEVLLPMTVLLPIVVLVHHHIHRNKKKFQCSVGRLSDTGRVTTKNRPMMWVHSTMVVIFDQMCV
jgi:hypothetical protein